LTGPFYYCDGVSGKVRNQFDKNGKNGQAKNSDIVPMLFQEHRDVLDPGQAGFICHLQEIN
jgi:hypothetical protein